MIFDWTGGAHQYFGHSFEWGWTSASTASSDAPVVIAPDELSGISFMEFNTRSWIINNS